MLDLGKIAGQLPGMSQYLTQEVTLSRQRLEQAQILFQKSCEQQEELMKRHQIWQERLIFHPAIPVEPLDTCKDLNTAPYSHTVFATDGSQISPSHHEIAYCYLINIGRVMLHYGQSLHPLLDSLPEVFYRPEDLYISKQWGIRTEEWMGYRRTVSEAQVLAEMAVQWVLPPGAHWDMPNLALVDGSLIYWFLDGLPSQAREIILFPVLEAWEQLKNYKIPLMGYLSASRSMETVNFFRLAACPYDHPNCFLHCGEKMERNPCQVIDPLRDTTIWSYYLKPGQRGAIWQSCQPILNLYDQSQKIYFCYVNVGTEIARVEFPSWVAQDSQLLDQSLSILLAQVHKGYGYPITLSEAHHQAVVKGGDRNRFFALLEAQMIRAGLVNVTTSYKETRKRQSIA
jgi:hypothetical protein